ncbi:MAG: hypothetical protein J7K73_04050 [Nanoarchaeota archaeon]|nr:hypothetical protein [Nanoarchaeota archaeon]
MAKRNNIDGKIKLGKLKNNISITDIREIKQENMGENKLILFEYAFSTDYTLEEPKDESLGEIKVVGELLFVEKKEKADEVLKEWKKSKKLKGTLLKLVLNIGFEEAQIEALALSRKVGLPPPVPLVRFRG